MTEQSKESVRVAVVVTCGVIPGTIEDKWTRNWVITNKEWDEAESTWRLLSDMNGKALAWACFLMGQPDHFNWVNTEWVWF